MDLTQIITKTGKTMKDFSIPESLVENDSELVELVLKSESMDDGERQYWFNLSEVMSEEQTEKLRGILTREQTKLAEIEEKYGKKEVVDPAEAKKRALDRAKDRVEKQQTLKEKEAAHNEKEEAEQDAILAELDNL